MKAQLVHQPLAIRPSDLDGYGVFAKCPIYSGMIIEECHTIKTKTVGPVELNNYYIEAREGYILPLGYGLIYNHDDTPNAQWYYDEAEEILIVRAIRSIEPDEEITVYYGKTWFEDRKKGKQIPIQRRSRFLTGPNSVLYLLDSLPGIILLLGIFYFSLKFWF